MAVTVRVFLSRRVANYVVTIGPGGRTDGNPYGVIYTVRIKWNVGEVLVLVE